MNRVGFVVGIAFGFCLVAARLTDYQVIHDTLLLRAPDLFLLMGAAVAVAMPSLWLLERRGLQTPLGGTLRIGRQRVQRRHVLGSAVFGVGWAMTGTCPGTALAMPFAGGGLAIFVVAGLFAGQWARDRMAESPRSTDARQLTARSATRI